MASYEASGEDQSAPQPGGLHELSPEQLQSLRKDQLSALIAAFARTASTSADTTSKPIWELEDFSATPGDQDAPLRFLIWQDQAHQWLTDHEHLPVALKLSRLRGSLKSEAQVEFNRLQNGIANQKDMETPYGLLDALRWSFVPGDTKEKALNRLHKWVFDKLDVLGSARRFLDDLRLAGIRADDETDFWAETFLSGLPLDIQERLTRNGKTTVAEYYARLQRLMAEQTYRKERCRLSQEDSAITLEQLGAYKRESKSYRASYGSQGVSLGKPSGAQRPVVKGANSSSKGKTFSQDPWCRYHRAYGHSTGTCKALEKQAWKQNKKPGELLAEIETTKKSRNFRSQIGTN